MATYNEGYHTFGLPYLFENEEQFYKVMDSQDMQDFFLSSEEDGFVTLTYYTSGARSFYTVDKPIRTPEDLKGLKLRVQDMKSQTDMVKTLGGTPVAMALGDVYTALETGIIDGSENNETAMVLGHGEVCKYFSLDQHSMIPDVMVISTSTWNSLTEEDQQILLQAAKESTADHIVAWDKEIEEAVETAKNELGVTFIEDVDKEAFQEATAGMVDEYCAQYPKVQEVVDIIEANK
ncbi:TRAP transporter substrate-binding protein DctP [Gemmiger sp.]